MENRKKSSQRWLVVAIALMLVGMIGASLVQTGGGKVTVKDLRWETTQGGQMSGLLFVPDGVSAEAPAPAIVVSHGMFNNREMQDLNFVELSRRGFVVLSMDMYNHGLSENTTSQIGGVVVGMYEAVKMLDSLAYVDSSRIGITGHSLGGMSSNVAITLDNMAETPLIAAVLLNSADATYVDADQAFADVYGNRDVGVIAPQYDEFFFKFPLPDGKEGNNAARDYINTANAQSFLYFGTEPAGQAPREPGIIYRQDVDGVEGTRVIYNPPILHPWSHFSARSTAATIEFFDTALGAPITIAPNDQVWQWKAVFNALGLLGFGIFIVAFAILMVFTPFFSSLRTKEPAVPATLDDTGKKWFWGGLLVSMIISGVLYMPMIKWANGFSTSLGTFHQSSPWSVSAWAAINGVVAIISMFLWYRVSGKKSGFSLRDRGVTLPLVQLGKTLLLSAIVVSVSYAWVFAADYFFKTDFRLWVLGVKAFGSDKIVVSLFPCMVLFLIFYVANSVAINCFNYNKIGRKEWMNTALLMLCNALPAVVLLLLQYVNFFITGHLMFPESNMAVVWLFPVAVILPLSALVTRKVYRATKNPYLAGVINAVIITLISCSNTLTWL